MLLGVDKRTSVLDYIVKNIIDKGEEDILSVTEDLSFDSEACRTSGNDTKREIEQLQQDYRTLRSEFEYVSNESEECNSKAAFHTDQYRTHLKVFLSDTSDSMDELQRVNSLMNRKIVTIAEYFGEDERNCDTTKIFSVLQQFKVAIEVSKENIDRKRRSQNK